MKWIVKVIVEAAPGQNIEHEIVTLDRPDLLSPANVGLSIAEGKTILESLQTQMVAAQVERHNVSVRCSSCGKAFRTKGYYQSCHFSYIDRLPEHVSYSRAGASRNDVNSNLILNL
jgi:hypothetical protein